MGKMNKEKGRFTFFPEELAVELLDTLFAAFQVNLSPSSGLLNGKQVSS